MSDMMIIISYFILIIRRKWIFCVHLLFIYGTYFTTSF